MIMVRFYLICGFKNIVSQVSLCELFYIFKTTEFIIIFVIFLQNKHSLFESLFDSYHCIQQTLMSHIMSAKAEDEKDEVVDDLRYAFIELNNDANDIMLK